MKSLTWSLIAISAAVSVACYTGCNQRRSGDGSAAGNAEETSRSGSSSDSFVVDESGVMRLPPPNDLAQHQGVAVTVKEHASAGAKALRPGNAWIYDSKPTGNGAFLVSAASKPGTVGGEMIRRIDLGKSIVEYDYDKETKGAQGAYILVTDEMRSVVPSKYIDADGLFSGIICGFVPGPNKTVIALSGASDGGVAFVINPYEEAQAFTPLQAIKFPYADNPCRAVYSDELHKLYVVDIAQPGANSGSEGIFVADIYNDGRGSTASFYRFDAKKIVNSHCLSNFLGLDIFDDTLYLLSGNGRFDADWDNVIYRVPLNKAGEPIFDETKYTRTNNPIMRSQGCPLSSWNLSAISVAESADGPVLLTTGTASTLAWDISGDELKKIDLNPSKPGVQGFNLEDNGQGGLKFAFDPSGKSIFQLPHCRSNSNKVKLGGSNDVMLAYNITQIALPDLKLGDPIDIGYRDLLISLKNAAYKPQFPMYMRDFAVGTRHIAVLGNSVSNLSGLAAGADVSIIDRSKKSEIAFAKGDSKKAHEQKYGFKLAAGDDKFAGVEQNVHAVIWIP